MSTHRLVKYKHSMRMEMADRFLDELIAVARRSDLQKVRQVAEALAAWDHCADVEIRGAVLFEL